MIVTNISIDTIGLSVRAVNALHRINVHTVGDMLQYDEPRLLEVRNLGQKSVQEILAKIEEYRVLENADENTADLERYEDVLEWMESETGKVQILRWLEEKQIQIDVLEQLSAKAYNLLSLNGCVFLHQLVFQTKEDLLKIHRMDEHSALEILKWMDDYLRNKINDIFSAFCSDTRQQYVAIDNMRFVPEYQDYILEFVRRNDVSIETMSVSARAKNQLQRNGYQMLSDIIFLTEEQMKRIPSMGSTSVYLIQEWVVTYLNNHETRIRAFCSGNASVLWDDMAIRKKLLRLYQENPFAGFSLQEMTAKLELPEEFPESQLKKVIGLLIGEGKLEYVDFRCYRIYEKFESFLSGCDAVDSREKEILQKRLQGHTLEEIGQNLGMTRENVRRIIKSKITAIRNRYTLLTGDQWFDEDYYRYFYENYAFDRREASSGMGIPEAVWKYLDMMDAKQGKQELENALDDQKNLEIGLRLKVKNYLNRSKIFVDGVWVEKKRSELEPVIARKFCRDELSFDQYAKAFNDFLIEEEIACDENLYYTDAVMRSRKNRLADSRFILWKQNEMLRYYDIDSRDYTELLEALKLDVYENVEYSTLKFWREHPKLMEKYDVQDQYELHNLLRKIVPEGSFHDFHCGRTPHIRFGSFDRDVAILDILVEMAPVRVQDLCQRISDEYGFDPRVVLGTYLQPFSIYYHEGVYSIGQKAMRADRMEALHRMLPDDFYYLDEIRKTYAGLFPDADLEEINPYNLKSMGFIVLSKYVVQHHPSLEAYCENLLTREDIVDLRPLRSRLTYVVLFSSKLMELKRNLDVIEFEPGQILNFRKLARAGVTKEDIHAFCDAVYNYIPEGTYFNAKTLRADGFESDLYDLGFSDWFYANLLTSDDRFSYTNVFGNLILYRGKIDITIQSFLVKCVRQHEWIDVFDLMTELTDRYGCAVQEKSDITYRLKNTPVYHDKILDRLYTNVDLYYRDLEEGGF